jgi:chemotaxis protein CheX
MQNLDTTKVSEAVESVWSTMLGLQTSMNQAMMCSKLRPSILTGCIQITGAWQGAVTVECTGGLARRVAAIMFGSDVCDITPDQINDALGELTNIIGGNIKALLPEPSHLSMPAVTEGTDYFFSVPGSKQIAKLNFSCEGKPFQVTILQSHRGGATS